MIPDSAESEEHVRVYPFSLYPRDKRLLGRIADKRADGNESMMVRVMIREEAARLGLNGEKAEA